MSQKLTPSQLRELRECFNTFDSDKSGFISITELRKVCETLSLSVNERELKDLMKLMDKDGSGQIDFDEFSAIIAEQFYRKPTKSDLEAAFDYFDQDNSGFITEEELYCVMSHFRGSITKNEVAKMIRSIDRDSDSKINKREFISLMLGSN